MGGVTGYFTAKAKNLNVWTGTPKRNDYLIRASYTESLDGHDPFYGPDTHGTSGTLDQFVERYNGQTWMEIMTREKGTAGDRYN